MAQQSTFDLLRFVGCLSVQVLKHLLVSFNCLFNQLVILSELLNAFLLGILLGLDSLHLVVGPLLNQVQVGLEQ